MLIEVCWLLSAGDEERHKSHFFIGELETLREAIVVPGPRFPSGASRSGAGRLAVARPVPSLQ